MIKGEIASNTGEQYKLKLENGESFVLEKKYLPPTLNEIGQRFQLLFSGAGEAKVSPDDARALLNELLGA